ncbi:sigma factor-like helix-turn-helix DNA-binding protein [Sphingomonas sp. LaA6.9]|uniref:sigma factor-like helix-turn-helix DNA-binding protein n=1 Tax=Sphingomonas sp. LaA6.9 TaxID=2919914 RepID=UPI001F4F784D|nr:sigma factor-like helix-turn-helix DNA-binding protein [Sphingomonas sp. LaA6.9]MCJ8156577.1 hypothetical protein [Sphingomonas sp. LaA6.9]
MTRLIVAITACFGRLRGAHCAASSQSDTKLRARIDRALAELPEPTRTVFLMHRVDELSYGIIAERLGITSAQVEAHVAAALLHLARALHDDEA